MPFVWGECRHPYLMMFIYGLDNNILISGTLILGVYQEESKMWER